jgi:hypothetical protein
MASNFTRFLVTLSEDPQQLEAYQQNPHAVMNEAGLTPAEKTLLMSGDMQLIRQALVSDPGHKEAMGISSDQSPPPILVMLVRFVSNPAPSPLPKAGPIETGGSQGSSSGSKGA